MAKIIKDIESSFDAISTRIESYRSWLKSSKSHFETDKYVEELIQLQRLLKKLSSQADKSLEDLIGQYY